MTEKPIKKMHEQHAFMFLFCYILKTGDKNQKVLKKIKNNNSGLKWHKLFRLFSLKKGRMIQLLNTGI